MPSPVIVIDALDECQDIEDLIPILVELNSSKDTSVFLVSRKEQRLYELLSNTLAISLSDESDHLQADIETIIESDLSSRRRLSRLAEEIQSNISETLLSKSDGM